MIGFRRILPVAVALAAACSSVPYTGRSQFNLVDADTEAQLGLQAFQEVIGKEKLVKSGSQYEMVKRAADKIAAAADRDAKERGAPLGFHWEVVLIESPQVNAWCLPGGKMGVFTGILPVTKDEAGLAVVLGHEVSHAVAHHGAERMSQSMTAEIILGAADLGLSRSDPATRQAVIGALGAGANVGVLLPFSRTHESEADHIGLLLMAEAGYDPREGPKLWQRMQQLGGQQPPEWMSTHPSHETRIKDMEAWMPEALKRYDAAKANPKKTTAPPAAGAASAGPQPGAATKPKKPPIPLGGGA